MKSSKYNSVQRKSPKNKEKNNFLKSTNRDLKTVSKSLKSKDVSEDDDESIFTDRSFFEVGLPMHEKMQKYLNRVCTQCLGSQYAHKYMKELARKEKRNA